MDSAWYYFADISHSQFHASSRDLAKMRKQFFTHHEIDGEINGNTVISLSMELKFKGGL